MRNSKREELAVSQQYLANVHVSVRWCGVGVGVGYCENREIILLSGLNVGREGKRND